MTKTKLSDLLLDVWHNPVAHLLYTRYYDYHSEYKGDGTDEVLYWVTYACPITQIAMKRGLNLFEPRPVKWGTEIARFVSVDTGISEDVIQNYIADITQTKSFFDCLDRLIQGGN